MVPVFVDTLFFTSKFYVLQIFIGIPSHVQRKEILSVLTQDVAVCNDVNLEAVAESTPGYVGADLASLIQQAAYSAISRHPKVCVKHR